MEEIGDYVAYKVKRQEVEEEQGRIRGTVSSVTKMSTPAKWCAWDTGPRPGEGRTFRQTTKLTAKKALSCKPEGRRTGIKVSREGTGAECGGSL